MLRALKRPNKAMKRDAAVFAFSSCSLVGSISREPPRYQRKDSANPNTKQKIQISHIKRMILSFFVAIPPLIQNTQIGIFIPKLP